MSTQSKIDSRDNKRLFLFGIVAFVIVVVAAIGYYAYSQYRQPGSLVAPNPTKAAQKPATQDTTSP